jgi:predicted dehydrogenase
LVGCGQIADVHLSEIRKIGEAEVVGVCDRHLDLAEQAAARFGGPRTFTELDRMLDTVRPDVLHVTTPPQSHRPITLRALAAGAHVYVEKPLAVDRAEGEEMVRAARRHARLVCVGHDQLFDPAWEECRRLQRSGALGRVVHVDSVQGYDLSGPFGKVLSSDPEHWVHDLPGGLFQNTISHALYKITDFLPDEEPEAWATWFGNSGLAACPTELRVFLKGATTTGTLLFTSAARGVQRVTRIYGTRQVIEVDLDGQVLRRSRPNRLPGAFAKLETPFHQLREAGCSLRRNLWRFLRCDLHFFAGMNRLFRLFYQAVREGGEPPVPYGEALRVTGIMDRAFECCQRQDVRGNGEIVEASCGR